MKGLINSELAIIIVIMGMAIMAMPILQPIFPLLSTV